MLPVSSEKRRSKIAPSSLGGSRGLAGYRISRASVLDLNSTIRNEEQLGDNAEY